jgi:transcriptional regulator with XRE-family HTH domain
MPLTFSESVARRVRQLRERHGFSQQDLVTKLQNFGLPIDRSAIARLEVGKRGLIVEELMRLAFVLDVAPVHLLVDPDGEESIAPTPHSEVSPAEARAWICGRMPLVPQDPRMFWFERPKAEFEAVRDFLESAERGEYPMRTTEADR